MKWIEERDLFIAQTLAFVQSVTGQKPEIGNGTQPAAAVVANIAATRIPASNVSAAQFPAAHPSASNGVAANRAEPSVGITAPRMAPDRPGEFRIEMQKHIANFRAHQERFHREREEYFRVTLARARSGTGNEPAPFPSPEN
jgi:hypothetical protein